MRIEPRYLQVEEGDSVSFQCIAQGRPVPNVIWTKGVFECVFVCTCVCQI